MLLIRKLLGLLTTSERRHLALLIVMMLVVAVIDVLGIASILPFIAVLSNPELITSNKYLAFINTYMGVNSQEDFLFLLGVLVFLTLVLSLSFKAVTNYFQIRFVLLREHSIGLRLIESYLSQKYMWFLDKNSSDLGKTILSEVATVISGALMPVMVIISQSIIVLAMLFMLLMIDSFLVLLIGIILGGVYFLLYYSFSGLLKNIGQQRIKENKLRFLVVAEMFGAIKELKLAGLEFAYAKRFSKPAKNFAEVSALAIVIGIVPRYLLEAIAFGGMTLIVTYLMLLKGGLSSALPFIVLFVFAGYRLMPALQQIYSSFAQLRFVMPTIELISTHIHSELSRKLIKSEGGLKFDKFVCLSNIRFSYPNSQVNVLKNINCFFRKNKVTGIVGSTGSGKTTIVDLIMGLLEPNEGEILVDDQLISPGNLGSWQSLIGYVPQQIYLSDESVVANIAFGIEHSEINYEIVERVAKIANLHDFIINELPQGYQTMVGERGICLSGGQRQRLGIARALYRQPELLILDEATSALDNLTELAVMDAISNLSGRTTVILIAHRLSTVRKCDDIYVMDRGNVVGAGSYDELILHNKFFQNLVWANNVSIANKEI